MSSTRWRGNSPARGLRASRPFSSARARRVSSIHSPEARWPAGTSTQIDSTSRRLEKAAGFSPGLAGAGFAEEARPLGGETDRLRGREAEDAVVGERVRVGAERVAAHR